VFEGTDPAMKGFIYDVPNGLNHEQFTKTTKQLAIAMASDMGMYATELSGAFDTLNLVMPAAVPGSADPANVVAVHLWKRDLKMFDDAVQAQNTFKTKVFLKVEGQCTETMKSSVARHARFPAADAARDGFALLSIIEELSMGIEGRHNTADVIAKAKDQLLKLRQGHKALREYFENYKSKVATMGHIGGSLVETAVAEEVAHAHERVVPTVADNREAQDKSVAVIFIMHSAYPKYIVELHNDMLEGNDHYPVNLEAAYEIMHLRGPENTRGMHQAALAFAQPGAAAAAVEQDQRGVIVPGLNGRTYEHIHCRNCRA
jgi:hypothetical protein